MGASSLYAVLPTPLQHVTTALYGLHLCRVRYGRVSLETRRRLAVSERWPQEDLARLQASELRRVVIHAASRTRYYRELFRELRLDADQIRTPEDLQRLPVLDRATLFERAADLRAEGVAAVRNYFTSGTTGTTLTIPIDDGSRQRNYGFFTRALSWAGVEGGRGATFGGRPVVPARTDQPASVWRWNPAMRNRLFSSYHLSPANAAAYSRALCGYAPDYIDSYPSSVAILGALLAEARLPAPRPRAIVTSSETLTATQRELIEDVFGARCFDQYGSTEQSAWVTQCEHGTYHVHPEYGIVEVLRPDREPARPGESGEIVCTSFTNDAFPLLRYRIGDVAVMGEIGCPCRRAFPVLHEILGRLDDALCTPDGRRVGRLDPVFKGRRTIREAQIIQASEASLIVRVVAGPGYSDDDGVAVVKELEARLGPAMRITVERVANIERTTAGKFRAVVNRSHNAGEGSGWSVGGQSSRSGDSVR